MTVTKIRMRMLEDGRPQYLIAAAVGVAPSRISEYALGKRQIPPRLIYNFCQVFRCNVEDLLGFDDSTEPPLSAEYLSFDD
jgi:transcriptional regulator with XRE-family HTH domain